MPQATVLKFPDPGPCPGAVESGPCANCGARSLSVCARVTNDTLRSLNDLTEVVTLKTGETLVREGDAAGQVYNITSGSVRVYKLMADGRRQIIGFLFPGDFLGLGSGDEYAFSAEALEPVTSCRFSRRAYLDLANQHPDLEGALLERSTTELAAAQDHMLLLGRKTAMERVSSFLIDLSRRNARRGDDPAIVRLPMTRGEAADFLGLTLETVSRTLSALKNRRVIRQSASDAYEILDADALGVLCGD